MSEHYECLTATCDKRENGKVISPIDTGRASIGHEAKTDSDQARPPSCNQPATQQASPGVLTRSAACLTATCNQWENGKYISSIGIGQASIGHGAKTDSDLARLPGVDHAAGRTDSDPARPPAGDHPAAQHASQGVLTRSAARR
jgi:hypothetical protein